jgi:hypothetical protein
MRDKALKLTLALCVIVTLGTVLYQFHTRKPKKLEPPTAASSFLDEMSATNAKFAKELDTEQKGLDDAGRASAYRSWRPRYDEAVRAVYERHGKEIPDHLKVR